MTYILNIETATKNCSVAIAKDGITLLCKEMAEEENRRRETLSVLPIDYRRLASRVTPTNQYTKSIKRLGGTKTHLRFT